MNRAVAPNGSPYPIGGRDRPDAPGTTMHQAVTFVDGMALKCGVSLQRLDIAHRTHGTLNAALPRVLPDADHSTGRLVATRVNVRPCT